MKLLSSLWRSQRIPLLLWLAREGRVKKTEIVREFPGTQEFEVHNALRKLSAAGWVHVDRGPHKGTHYVTLVRSTVDDLAAELDRTLPGGWDAAEFNDLALFGELNLWRAPNRLRVLEAVRAGADTRRRMVERSGLSSVAVGRALLELLARGDVAKRDWCRWEDRNSGEQFYGYQPRSSQLRLLVSLLRGRAAA